MHPRSNLPSIKLQTQSRAQARPAGRMSDACKKIAVNGSNMFDEFGSLANLFRKIDMGLRHMLMHRPSVKVIKKLRRTPVFSMGLGLPLRPVSHCRPPGGPLPPPCSAAAPQARPLIRGGGGGGRASPGLERTALGAGDSDDTLAHAIVFIVSICAGLSNSGAACICPSLLERPGSRWHR